MGRNDADRATAETTGAERADAGPIAALGRMGIIPVVVIDDAGHAAPLAEATVLRRLAALGPDEVIVKDGARGCAALINGGSFTLPALTVPVVDLVGAGDAFAAAYLADRLAGESPEARLRTAMTAGAFAVAVPGDCEGLPRRHDVATLGRHREDGVR